MENTSALGAAVEPRDLYHACWSLVREVFIDRSKLVDWDSWEHRFDGQINTEADAVRFVRQMLESLGDAYTFLESTEDVALDAANEEAAGPVFSVRRLEGGVGYLRIRTFDIEEFCSQMWEAFKALGKLGETRGLIIDLRGNPGGFIEHANMATSFFMDGGPTAIYEKQTAKGFMRRVCRLEKDNFVVDVTSDFMDAYVREFERYPNVFAGEPIVILIDGGTASSAELFAAIMADNGRAILVGVDSYGKGIGQLVRRMALGTKVHVTNARFYGPSNRWFGDARQTTIIGITPDVVVRNVDGEDRQLEEALRIVLRKREEAGTPVTAVA
jgi:C-terminal processing protease CtpA/Prc